MRIKRSIQSVFRRRDFAGLLCMVSALIASGAKGQEGAPRSASPIAAALRPFVDRHSLAGAVALVATQDKLLSLDAVGHADVAARKPMKTDALFWIASQSKPMTAAAFMMLVDEGKANLDDPVEKYLPEFKGQMLAVERDSEHVLLRQPAHSISSSRPAPNTNTAMPASTPWAASSKSSAGCPTRSSWKCACSSRSP